MAKLLITILLSFYSSSLFAQVAEDRKPELLATGAVITFDEVCLKIYTDYDKSIQWMEQHKLAENKSKSADPYRESPTDRVFLVGSSLARYVVTFGKENYCIVYGHGADRKVVESVLQKLMSGYAKSWKSEFIEIRKERPRENEEVVGYVANIPGTDKPILGIHTSYIWLEDMSGVLVKISSSSLKRLQTLKKANKLK